MSKKFLTAVVAAGVLWIVVLGQVFCTRIWVAKKGLTQAFTGNNMVVMQETKQDLYGNEYIEGTCQGKLSSGEESGTENDAAAWRNGADGFQGHLGKGCFCGVWLHKWHQKSQED